MDLVARAKGFLILHALVTRAIPNATFALSRRSRSRLGRIV